MDERIRVRTFNRRPARSADSSRSYPGDERRVLSPETLQGSATAPARSRAGRRRRPQYRRNPRPLIITEPVMRNGPHEGPLRINQPHRRWPTFTPPQWPAFAPPLTPVGIEDAIADFVTEMATSVPMKGNEALPLGLRMAMCIGYICTILHSFEAATSVRSKF